MSFASLPFELLARICRINAYKQCNPSLDIPGPLRDTISASQVCHSWRSGIISAPELWRVFINPYHPCAQWRDLLLKRSEPLSIEFMDSCFSCEAGQRHYDTHLEMQSGMHMRLRKYKFQPYCRAESIPSHSSAWPSEPNSWPELQHLRLLFDAAYFGRHGARDDSLSLPDNFPGLATPILEHLNLAYCYMSDWHRLVTMGRTLTILRIFWPPSSLCPDRWIEVLRDLPHLKTLRLIKAMDTHCNHPHSSNRLTLGVKEFCLYDFVHACTSFCSRINLSQECCQTDITCWRDLAFEATVKDDAKNVLFHMERFLSQIVVDAPRIIISHSFLQIDGRPLGPPSYSHRKCQPLITDYSTKFSVEFSLSEAVVEAIVFPGLLDLVRPLSSITEIIETQHTEYLIPEACDLLFEFLVQCQSVCFMQGVSYSWWKRLCSRLLPAVDGAMSDTTKPLFPKLRALGFEHRVFIGEGPGWAVIIPFDDLKAFCKHRASIGAPLERISMVHQDAFEINSSGDIDSNLFEEEEAGEDGEGEKAGPVGQ
ncbi:hypothetical protein AGABI1DRAFT_131798 [Agaricus bisporus var. burnettii JB137-S8]|uniref:F-box domain-containing protein n=1 Tax=Agaricus bisporus var. burnettii (strain JB137-S8 / ATCC MYA-4627 / FGSC 10392) TaxID=597362 RepID=K5WZ45_AGABU|nr:uncharacterized protein AGABI1DRAFT_131798 [Agaricus bisporus var. burnettii JB137-S8]EKM75892.1 hypothetical protein AGABI1DRAFT_131798 [Agaricus bisporus var. burnettii JB137-S8]